MTTTQTEPATDGQSRLRHRALDAVRQAAHLSHEARLFKTLATDAGEDAIRMARRTVKKAQQGAFDARDEVTYRVKREPLKALGLAFLAGAFVGAALGFCRRKRSHTKQEGSTA